MAKSFRITTEQNQMGSSAMTGTDATECVKLKTCREWAHEYATKGCPVIPIYNAINGVCTCWEKEKCGSPAKHPMTPHGLSDGSIDHGQIDAWFDRYPDANVAMVLGSLAGITVLDIDKKHGGDASIADKFDAMPQVETSSGSRHLYFGYGGERNRKIVAGYELRGEGGYVVAPPSVHVSGAVYKWTNSLDQYTRPKFPGLDVVKVAIAAMQGGSTRADPPEQGADGHRTKIPEGNRNDFLAREAGKLRRIGHVAEVLDDMLQTINAAWCDPLCDRAEVSKVAASIGNLGWKSDFQYLAQVVGKEWEFLWPNKLPFGSLVVFHSKGDVGKSCVCLAIASMASTASDWPTGDTNVHAPMKTLILTAEDDRAKTMKKRLAWQGGDQTKIAVMSGFAKGDEKKMLSITQDLNWLEDKVVSDGIRILVFDPIVDFYGDGVDQNGNREVRKCLTPLVAMAERHNVLLIGLNHQTKKATETAGDKSIGTVALRNVARVSFYFDFDADDPQPNPKLRRRVMLCDKGNILYNKVGITYGWQGEDMPLTFGGPCRTSPDEKMYRLLEQSREAAKPKGMCRRWLFELLEEDPMAIDEIKKLAKEKDFSEHILRAASKDLRVITGRHGFGGGCTWELPSSILAP
ncbi:MAG: bifunctional DNA primase/polymerase [Planctomycetota bacterium]|nr:bifunctional DNA primase/polymerase [Planctomycetota bacterium]